MQYFLGATFKEINIMLKVVIIYILIIVISYIIGVNMRLVNPKCSGGICPPPKEYSEQK